MSSKEFLDIGLDIVKKNPGLQNGAHKKISGHVKRYAYSTVILQGLTATFVLFTFITCLTLGILILKKKT